jgi:hypothetical protein
VVETAVLSSAGGVSPSLGFPRSRVWFLVGVVEALAAMPVWNKSLQTSHALLVFRFDVGGEFVGWISHCGVPVLVVHRHLGIASA